MKISRLFCQQFLSAPVPPAEELAALLTARGLEVDSIAPAAAAAGIVAGEITACRPHPNADKLQLCTVDIGGDSPLELVCGAPNARAGLRVAVAPPGATLDGTALRAREIRGVVSAGMICSAAELGIGGDKGGILELSAADGDIGSALDESLLLNDHVLEVNVTPNRGDCLSHLGLAREIAAAAGMEVVPPLLPAAADNDEAYPVQIDEEVAALCPYYGCVVVRAADCARPLPQRWRTLIERCGARSVSAVVDITNYIMLAYGQPLHAFDLDKLQGGIRVRAAAAGERLAVLDGSEVTCRADTLLIADGARALALAGVMGGGDSGITAATKNILLEGAHFVPDVVAGRARQFKLHSEAAFRFERGVDSNLPPLALAQAAACIKQVCGGKIGRLVAEAGAAPPPAAPITLPVARIGQVLGIDIAADAAVQSLNSIGLTARLQPQAAEPTIEAQAPPWRFDIKIAEDLIEEVVRLHGYDNLPETLPAGARALQPPPRLSLPQAARAFFAAHGFYEIISYAFVAPQWQRALSATAPQPLANPMSEEMSVMRTTLWGGLIDRALFNLRRRQERIFLFEVGRCFLPASGGQLPRQPLTAAGIMHGARQPAQWADSGRLADFFDAKGLLEMFLAGARADIAFAPLAADAAEAVALHPGKAAAIYVGGAEVGAVGELHPSNPLGEDFRAPPILFSLDLEALAACWQCGVVPVPALSRLPLLWRDLALVVDADLPAGELLSAARAAAPAPPVTEVRLFDFFPGDGKRLPAGKKSCGLRFFMQGGAANLTGAEIEQAVEAVSTALKNRYRVELRE